MTSAGLWDVGLVVVPRFVLNSVSVFSKPVMIVTHHTMFLIDLTSLLKFKF